MDAAPLPRPPAVAPGSTPRASGPRSGRSRQARDSPSPLLISILSTEHFFSRRRSRDRHSRRQRNNHTSSPTSGRPPAAHRHWQTTPWPVLSVEEILAMTIVRTPGASPGQASTESTAHPARPRRDQVAHTDQIAILCAARAPTAPAARTEGRTASSCKHTARQSTQLPTGQRQRP